jgi:hypothetical protein
LFLGLAVASDPDSRWLFLVPHVRPQLLCFSAALNIALFVRDRKTHPPFFFFQKRDSNNKEP